MQPRKYMLCTGHCVPYKDLHKHPNAHIIGHLRTLLDEKQKVTALARWEVSISATVVPPLEPEIDCDYIGDARNIKCRHAGCENKFRWEISPSAARIVIDKHTSTDEYLLRKGG